MKGEGEEEVEGSRGPLSPFSLPPERRLRGAARATRAVPRGEEGGLAVGNIDAVELRESLDHEYDVAEVDRQRRLVDLGARLDQMARSM